MAEQKLNMKKVQAALQTLGKQLFYKRIFREEDKKAERRLKKYKQSKLLPKLMQPQRFLDLSYNFRVYGDLIYQNIPNDTDYNFGNYRPFSTEFTILNISNNKEKKFVKVKLVSNITTSAPTKLLFDQLESSGNKEALELRRLMETVAQDFDNAEVEIENYTQNLVVPTEVVQAERKYQSEFKNTYHSKIKELLNDLDKENKAPNFIASYTKEPKTELKIKSLKFSYSLISYLDYSVEKFIDNIMEKGIPWFYGYDDLISYTKLIYAQQSLFNPYNFGYQFNQFDHQTIMIQKSNDSLERVSCSQLNAFLHTRSYFEMSYIRYFQIK